MSDRKYQRENSKNQNQKSDKWKDLNFQFSEGCTVAKEDYRKKVVSELKTSNPKKRYSKVKRISYQH